MEESTTSVEDATPEKMESTQAEASPEESEESESDESEAEENEPTEVEKADSDEAAETSEDDVEGIFRSPNKGVLLGHFCCRFASRLEIEAASFQNIAVPCIHSP